ncbi:hypothetical protein WHU31_16245 [Escherichia coli]|uniref:hypothetical protein n=1 Tax=Escherichia coli TaxID=562 RepID=UPI0030CB3D50
MIKHTKPFLGIDYDLLAITSLVINGKTKEVKLHHKNHLFLFVKFIWHIPKGNTIFERYW